MPHSDNYPRNIDSFINKDPGINGESVLYNILEKFPGGVVIDAMHSVYRGPVQDDLKRLIKGFCPKPNESRRLKLSNNGLALLDSFLKSLVR